MNQTEDKTDATPTDATRRKPGRKWYALSALLLIGSVGLFAMAVTLGGKKLHDRIDNMPHLVGPTGDTPVTITLDKPGKYYVFYENRGTFEGTAYDTPRHQVWTHPLATSMTCTLTRAETGDQVEVRLPEVGGDYDKTKVTEDLIFPYRFPDREGHGVWTFEIDEPGDYTIALDYVDGVNVDPETLELRDDLTRDMQSQMTSEQGAEYEAQRTQEQTELAIAHIEPVDVLFAVGQDPTEGIYFQLIGIKGAATVLAFGFTASVLITLVTFMLRNGHVTPRGELANVRRPGDGRD